MTNLNYNSISVGQHVIARGIYSLPASGVTTLDATGSSSTNTGSVRLETTELFGTVVSSGAGGVVLDLANIEYWPVSIYDFAGNGAAGVTPTAYEINSGTLALPAGTVTGGPLWVDGISAPFGSAPPDFLATSLNAEPSVPARLQVAWTAGTTTPFATLTASGLTIDLANTHLGPAVIEIGAETIQLKSLAATPNIVPQPAPAVTAGLPPVFLPSYAIGNLSATANTTTITVFNSFAPFVTQIPKSVVAATPALQFVAMGVYNRATNTFTASSIDVVN
jgi:hypothetical protein